MQVGQVCSREVYCVGREEPLARAAHELLHRHVGALVVTQGEGKAIVPVGMVTDRDIVCGQVARRSDLFCLIVADVMTPEPLLVSETQDLAEAVQRMQERGVRRAPVVAESGNLVGIVSLDDLLPVVARNLSSLATLLDRQPAQER